jgi:unsaturated chondroitin disaccharide hydrolase
MPPEPDRHARILALAPLLSATIVGCTSVPPGDAGDTALLAMIDASLDRAVQQYTALDEALPDTAFPRTVDPDGTLRTSNSAWWTSGFFAGSLWYLYEYTARHLELPQGVTRGNSWP